MNACKGWASCLPRQPPLGKFSTDHIGWRLRLPKKVRKNSTSSVRDPGRIAPLCRRPLPFQGREFWSRLRRFTWSAGIVRAPPDGRARSPAQPARGQRRHSWALAAKLIIAEAVRPAESHRRREADRGGSRRVAWVLGRAIRCRLDGLGAGKRGPRAGNRGPWCSGSAEPAAMLEHIAPENAPGRLQVTSRVADLQMAAGNLDRAAVLLRHLLDRMPPRDFVAADGPRRELFRPACGTG